MRIFPDGSYFFLREKSLLSAAAFAVWTSGERGKRRLPAAR